MAKTKYNLHLKGYVGGWDFDSDYVDFVLNKNTDKEVAVLIDSLGGQLNTALSISSAFRRHGNVHVHFVGMNASAATIASMGAKRITMGSLGYVSRAPVLTVVLRVGQLERYGYAESHRQSGKAEV